MTETIITVQGRFSAYYPAERATLSLSIHLENADREAVFAATGESASNIRERIVEAFDRTAGPITWWSSDNVQVWSEKPWNHEGVQLPPVFHARIGFTAKFRDFGRLSSFVEDAATVPGVTIAHLEWELTEASRSGVIAEVRSRAVKDAVAKASVYAQSIGLGTVRAIALADQGMLSDLSGPPIPAGAYDMMRVSKASDLDGPELSLKPEDIEIEAVVDARFVAN